MDWNRSRARRRRGPRGAPGGIDDLAARDARRAARKPMTRGDQLVERAANRLDAFARQAAGEPGFKGKLAKPFADDAQLLRGMRPSRIAARLRGESANGDTPTAPIEPVRQEKPKRASSGRGPNPIVLAAGAFAVGLLLAKVVDWRSHAHPR